LCALVNALVNQDYGHEISLVVKPIDIQLLLRKEFCLFWTKIYKIMWLYLSGANSKIMSSIHLTTVKLQWPILSQKTKK